MELQIGQLEEVYSLDELPELKEDLKFFACIGGTKNYQCFIESKKLSRASFMKKYMDRLDKCHLPIYQDDDIIISQDAQIPIPGFYIVAPKKYCRTFSDLDLNIYKKCMRISFKIKNFLKDNFDIEKVYMYYDEHYMKPASVHFWIMPIYNEIINSNKLDATILSNDIWSYQELFQFQFTKEKIYKMNDKLRSFLEREIV